MVDATASILNMMFAPLLGMNPILSLIGISVVLTFIITILYRFLTDPKKLKEMRDRAKEISQKSKEVAKANPEEAKKMTDEMLSITNKQMMASMKPMLATLLIAALFLPWMAATFTGTVANLPIDVPFVGSSVGWLGWYLIISIPASQMLRKILGVDL
jgi:uncharacterized membrane protein (DUF106 family)